MTPGQKLQQLATLHRLTVAGVRRYIDAGQRLRYDYTSQCWLLGDVVQNCAHPGAMACDCYARRHAGERIA